MQLQTAADIGLSVPATLLSNDPLVAREFVAAAPGRVVVTPLSSTVLAERGRHLITFAGIADADEMAGHVFEESFSATVHLLQEWVPKEREARVTVCGRSVPERRAIDAHDTDDMVRWRERVYSDTSLVVQTTPTPDGIRDMSTASLSIATARTIGGSTARSGLLPQ